MPYISSTTTAALDGRRAVTDIRTERQIIVARALTWASDDNDTEHRRKVEATLRAMGLDEFLPPDEQQYTFSLTEFRSLLPDTVEITSEGVIPDTEDFAEKVDNILKGYAEDFTRKIEQGDVEIPPAVTSGSHVDIAAVVQEWGDFDSPYPPAGSEEVENFRRRAITTALQHGEELDYCSTLEHAIRCIGLADYLPPSTQKITIPIPTDLTYVTFEVELTRAGEPRPHRHKRALADALADLLDNHEIGDYTPA